MQGGVAIGLIGTNGAGKSAVSDYLVGRGFHTVSLSDRVREAADEQHLPHTRDVLTHLANVMKNEHGADVLARRSHELVKANKDPNTPVVYDSIRNIAEVSYLRNKGVIMLGIDAPIALRYQRVKQRLRVGDDVTFDTFVAHDARERDGSSSGQNLTLALAECHTIVINDHTLARLHDQINHFLGTLVTEGMSKWQA